MNINVNQLFGKTDGISGMVSDYNSIKNGSYGKLMKSYYKDQTKGTNAASKSNKSYKTTTLDKIMDDRKNPKVTIEVADANSKLSSSLKTLATSLSSLQSKYTYKNNEKYVGIYIYEFCVEKSFLNNPIHNTKAMKEFFFKFFN